MDSVTINFKDNIDINKLYHQLKKYYPDIKIIKNKTNIDELLIASESSLDFWYNDIDDEVWNNA